jgi:hypothetical protein
MKHKILTIGIFLLFAAETLAQNDKCSNSTLSISLNTSKTIYHKRGTPYYAVKPKAFSTVHDSSKISLVKEASDLNVNIPGIYTECYLATDIEALSVKCCRTIIVRDSSSSPAKISSFSSNQINIFPNPVTGKQINIKITHPNSSETITIQVRDFLGKEILNVEYPGGQGIISLSTEQYDLKCGSYYVTLRQGDALVHKLIMIQ